MMDQRANFDPDLQKELLHHSGHFRISKYDNGLWDARGGPTAGATVGSRVHEFGRGNSSSN
jgi:hypothetical protein